MILKDSLASFLKNRLQKINIGYWFFLNEGHRDKTGRGLTKD